jgi:AraC-like DNA-binding protein
MEISRIEIASPQPGIERMSALFRGFSFSPHRHDTYTIGVTTAGVQAFGYRGAARYSLPGQVFVLHPDELHDGRAGDDGAFGYSTAYIDPALILECADAKVLPFLRDPISDEEPLRRAVLDMLSLRHGNGAELATVDALVALVDALARAAALPTSRTTAIDTRAMGAVREFLRSQRDTRISIAALESLSGLSRFQLARQFRAAYGVSPYRFHVLRRLGRARELLSRGQSLADVALICGFADQAHLSRQFRDAFGLSPGQWRAMATNPSPAPAPR